MEAVCDLDRIPLEGRDTQSKLQGHHDDEKDTGHPGSIDAIYNDASYGIVLSIAIALIVTAGIILLMWSRVRKSKGTSLGKDISEPSER